MSTSLSSLSISLPAGIILAACLGAPAPAEAAATDPCAKEMPCTLPGVSVGTITIQEAGLLDPDQTTPEEASIQAPSQGSPRKDQKLQSIGGALLWNPATAIPRPKPGVVTQTYFKGTIGCFVTWIQVPHHTYYDPSSTPAGPGVPPIADNPCDTKGG